MEIESDLFGAADLRSELESQLAHLPDATVNFAANFRAGPGTNYPVIGDQLEDDRVKPFVQTPDGQWIKLAQGAWIRASLLNEVSLDLALAQQIPTVPGAATTAPEAPLTATEYFNLGLDLAEVKKYLQAEAAYAEAIEDLNSAIRLAPDYASAYAFRGIAKALQGNYTQAVADLDEAIDRASD